MLVVLVHDAQAMPRCSVRFIGIFWQSVRPPDIVVAYGA